MNPNQQQPIPLDPNVVALSKAMMQHESGNNFTAKGASGEYGVAQWQEPTWKAEATKYLGYVPKWGTPEMTPDVQKAVLYSKLNDLKQQGLNPAQIAAQHNSGTSSNWENKIGTNSYGVKYNVPAYVKAVTDLYQTFKQQPVEQPTQPIEQANPNTGVLGTNPNDSLYGKILNNSITRGIQSFFPGQKVGQAMGTSIAQIGSEGLTGNKAQESDQLYIQTLQNERAKALAQGKDTSHWDTALANFKPTESFVKQDVTPLQVGGDIANIALTTAIPGAGEGLGLPARLATQTAIGAGMGGAGAVAEGNTNISEIATQGAIGGALGFAGGALGEAMTGLANKLPNRLIANTLPQLKNPETIDYAVNHIKLGTPQKMLQSSEQALSSYNKQINAILEHPQYAHIKIGSTGLIDETLNQFPNSEYTSKYIFKRLKTLIPSEAKIFSKLESGGTLSLPEVNALRQKIDSVTYKSIIDSPEIKAGKELAGAFGNALRSTVKGEAEESIPIFANYAKEINLKKALLKLNAKESHKSFFTFKDLLSTGIGSTLAGLPGAVGAATVEKIVSSPVTKVGVAKTAKALQPTIKTASKLVKTGTAMSAK